MHEKGELELMILASHAAPHAVFTCSTLGYQKGAGGARGAVRSQSYVWCSAPKLKFSVGLPYPLC